MIASFDHENIDLGSPNLHLKELLYGPTYPPNFVFLAHTGAEIAGGGVTDSTPPPLPGRVILRPSPGSVKDIAYEMNGFYLAQLVGYTSH